MRIKRGQTKRAQHKKIKKLAKGYRLTISTSHKKASDAVLHAGQYAAKHRRKKKGVTRRSNIMMLNAGVRMYGLTYSKFLAGLKKAKIELDRKTLADLALNEPEILKSLVEEVK